jgi:hypothetical protein
MNKIIQTINAMIIKANKISHITEGQGSELFFLFDNKYKWSIVRGEEEYFLHYYKTDISLTELAKIQEWDQLEDVFTTFSTKDIKGREANESFADLYQLLRNKRFDMDKVMDDIIGDEIL